jgi:hypothetical protein
MFHGIIHKVELLKLRPDLDGTHFRVIIMPVTASFQSDVCCGTLQIFHGHQSLHLTELLKLETCKFF